MQNEERIRQRAYEIWEREGRPEGREQEHWTRACQEIASEDARVATAAGETTPGAAPTVNAPDGGATPAEAAAAATTVGAPTAQKRRKAEAAPTASATRPPRAPRSKRPG